MMLKASAPESIDLASVPKQHSIAGQTIKKLPAVAMINRS